MKGFFQENIIKYRKKNNLSVEDAAALLSFPVNSLIELENGDREPSLEELNKFSSVYHVSYKKLLKRRHVYKIKQRTLVGFNRYGLKQGWSVIAIPIMAFIALCMLFVPGFFVQGSGLVSLIKIMFSAGNVKFMVLGGIMICVLAYIIIYWTSVLAHGNYARAKLKVTNNVMLALFSAITFILTLICLMSFKTEISVGGVFTYIVLFGISLTQLILLIIMNLDGGENSNEQVYIFHESDLSGYETKHWFTLGVVALAIISLCLFFTVIVYDGKIAWLGINSTMFEMSFGTNASFMTVFIGSLCVASLIFDIVYWVIICTLKRVDRRQTGRANNVLMVIVNGILFISTISFMSYFGFEYFTVGGIMLYVALFLTSIYAIITLPIINCNKKSLYIEDSKGLRKVRAVQGQKPGKIMAYKFPALLQYLLVILLGISVGISFLDSSIMYVAYISAATLLLEIVFLILQRNGRYVNIPTFIFGMVMNTIIGLFNIFLLGVSLFGTLNLGARIALPIVSGAIVIVYVCIAFFLKPIRDVSQQL